MRFALPLLIFLGLLGLLYLGLHIDPRQVPSPLVDKPAPAFTVEDLQQPQTVFTERRLYVQGPALFNVWASWCVACREEHPVLLELARRGVVPIYGLNYKDTHKDAEQWLAQFGNPYTAIAYDPQGKVGLDWGVYGVPETFLIDRQGIIRYKYIGPLTPQIVQDDLLPRLTKLKQGP